MCESGWAALLKVQGRAALTSPLSYKQARRLVAGTVQFGLWLQSRFVVLFSGTWGHIGCQWVNWMQRLVTQTFQMRGQVLFDWISYLEWTFQFKPVLICGTTKVWFLRLHFLTKMGSLHVRSGLRDNVPVHTLKAGVGG